MYIIHVYFHVFSGWRADQLPRSLARQRHACLHRCHSQMGRATHAHSRPAQSRQFSVSKSWKFPLFLCGQFANVHIKTNMSKTQTHSRPAQSRQFPVSGSGKFPLFFGLENSKNPSYKNKISTTNAHSRPDQSRQFLVSGSWKFPLFFWSRKF